MKRNPNLLMALSASILVFTVIWAQNYRVLDTVTVGSDADQATVVFNVIVPQAVTYSFNVHTQTDVLLNVTAVSGPNNLTVTRVAKAQDSTGWMAEYQFSFTPAKGTVYVDITARDTTQSEQPVILKGTGLVMAPLLPLDPNYDYTLARTDPREHQKAVKVTQRYWFVQGIPADQWAYNVRF